MDTKNRTKYILNNGGILYKNRFVLEVVKAYLKKKPSDFSVLNEVFYKDLQVDSTGVINKLEDVLQKYNKHKNKRHFIKDSEILKSNDGIKFVVSTEWNIINVQNIVEIAKKEGFEVIEVLKK